MHRWNQEHFGEKFMPTIEEIIAQRLEAAERALAALEEQRRELLWKITEYRGLLGERNVPRRPGLPLDSILAAEKPYARMTAAQTMEAVLRKSVRPMRIIELAAAAMEGGYGGDDADRDKIVPNFSSTLSRSMKAGGSPFVRGDGRGVIQLKEWTHDHHDKEDA
jgi:hypothetical protein